MSLAAQMLAATAEAQSRLAEIGGAEQDAENSLYSGEAYKAVYGQPQVTREMMQGGGYRQFTIVPTTTTRAQFDTAPVAQNLWTRTDITPQITYRIKVVNLHDPYVYGLTLVRVGEVGS